jgi:hypothetical protein
MGTLSLLLPRPAAVFKQPFNHQSPGRRANLIVLRSITARKERRCFWTEPFLPKGLACPQFPALNSLLGGATRHRQRVVRGKSR